MMPDKSETNSEQGCTKGRYSGMAAVVNASVMRTFSFLDALGNN